MGSVTKSYPCWPVTQPDHFSLLVLQMGRFQVISYWCKVISSMFLLQKKNCDIDLGYKIEIFIGKIYVVNGTWPVYSYWPLFNSFLVSPQKGWLLVQKKRLKRMVGPWGKCITISWGKPIVLGRKGKTGRRGLYILLNP